MIKFLQRWRNKLELKGAGLRKAELDDVNFATEMLVEGAKSGHFSSNILIEPHQSNHREMYKLLTQGIGALTDTERGREFKHANLLIYRSPPLGNAGFIHIAEKYEGSRNEVWEILATGISEKHRGRGHGRNMLKIFLSHFPTELALYARCFHASEPMVQLLKSVGFGLTGTVPGTTPENLKGLQ